MLSAFAVIFGMVVFAAVLRGGTSLADAIVVGFASLGALFVAARFGWLGKESAVLGRLLGRLAGTPARLRRKFAGAFRVAAASISADVTIAPALIQVSVAQTNAVNRAVNAAQAGEAPGAMPVALRKNHTLLHVLDEDSREHRGGASAEGQP
jgi:hypothetical protein